MNVTGLFCSLWKIHSISAKEKNINMETGSLHKKQYYHASLKNRHKIISHIKILKFFVTLPLLRSLPHMLWPRIFLFDQIHSNVLVICGRLRHPENGHHFSTTIKTKIKVHTKHCMSHTRTEPVWVPVTTVFPSSEKAQLSTPSVPEGEADLQKNELQYESKKLTKVTLL